MCTFLSADQNSPLTIEDRIIYGLAASHSSACAAHGASAVLPACDATKQVGISLRAVAQKMRMPILRHLCADSPPAQNREWKERSSGRAHNSRALTALFGRGCSENADLDSAALVREITASTEPRMSKSGPLRTERVGHSLKFVALTCDFILKSQIVQSGSAGGPAVLGGVGERPIFIIGGERSAVVSRAVSGYGTSELQDPCLPAASI
jgi:hypothetical protein